MRPRKESMALKTLLTDSAQLLRLAQVTARGLNEQHEELFTDEALLRAAIAWAQYAQKAHLAAVEHAKDSAKDRRFVEITRRRRIRAENHLRMRLTATIARKCEVIKDERLLKVAGFALALLH
jgi:hypothetical protein